ncbi:hypothetical protein [Methylophaga sp. OBS3]|uniref:hypothetical protein n=1 Tax=Methylophaga sp. OBS3 TaxID=2991934 RepID=UPI00224F2C0A|nr:hypothetical protein [Methylophaga sp. OBS3]MCX4188983.1 hypothetical protein [Methylophaga sp. OBS3]
MNLKYLMLAMSLTAMPVMADSSETLDAAVGGAIGGGLGAAVGNEVGGREGAIIGGAIGAGTGAAVTTDGDDHHHDHHDGRVYIDDGHRGHCPPGQAKKGNC